MYPNELPIFSILVVSGRISDSEALRMWVREEAERSLGMAMIFSMVTAIEDWLAKQKKASGMGDTLTKEEKPLIQDDFVLVIVQFVFISFIGLLLCLDYERWSCDNRKLYGLECKILD